MHRHLIIGVAAGLLGLVGAWLFASEPPPVDWDNAATNLWRLVHIPAWVIAFAIDRNPHGGGATPVLVGVFLQWYIIGWAASWLSARMRMRRGHDAA